MIIFVWFLVLGLLLLATATLAWFLLHHPGLKILQNGLPAGLKDIGSNNPRHNYQAELWKWETMHDENVCKDCLERSTWPAMDIADWMKEGMPRTPEAETKCSENCRCQLVRYYPGVYANKKYFNQS